ncbi:MAG: type II toxin-antitoxin system RelE/ParE family toxin [Chloroflexia bacterium]|nr:type II toxin-antitoxin system RelE/ParE family toxin [Chloroflexia bacterium]
MSARPLVFVGSSRDDLRQFPSEVTKVVGVALFEAQMGGTHGIVKLLQGFPGHRMYQASESFQGDAYRVVYTIKDETLYVLHAFKKKSTKGRAMPQPDKDLIVRRLKAI